MKTINKILTAAAAIALSTSCVTYYTVIPEIHPDGSMTRTVYAEADSACLAGDLTVEATSRRANPLGFILLGLIVISCAVIFFRPRR